MLRKKNVNSFIYMMEVLYINKKKIKQLLFNINLLLKYFVYLTCFWEKENLMLKKIGIFCKNILYNFRDH